MANMMKNVIQPGLNLKKQKSMSPEIDVSANLKLRRTTDRVYRDFSKSNVKKTTELRLITNHDDNECCESQNSNSIKDTDELNSQSQSQISSEKDKFNDDGSDCSQPELCSADDSSALITSEGLKSIMEVAYSDGKSSFEIA